jgi:hypothetical protein
MQDPIGPEPTGLAFYGVIRCIFVYPFIFIKDTFM